jgi:hypothetical protein
VRTLAAGARSRQVASQQRLDCLDNRATELELQVPRFPRDQRVVGREKLARSDETLAAQTAAAEMAVAKLDGSGVGIAIARDLAQQIIVVTNVRDDSGRAKFRGGEI